LFFCFKAVINVEFKLLKYEKNYSYNDDCIFNRGFRPETG